MEDETCCCWRYVSGRVCPACFSGNHAECIILNKEKPSEE